MQIFPEFQGISYPIKKTPEFKTVIEQTVSGKETRFSNASLPLWRFTLCFEFLTKADYEKILAFYHSVKGAKDSFLFLDKTDYQAIDQKIAIGDGVTNNFQLYKNISGLKYPIKNIVSIEYVKVSETAVDYKLLPDGIISFTNPPAKDVIITAGFGYYYQVKFSKETNEYEKFAYDLWNLNSLEFETVK